MGIQACSIPHHELATGHAYNGKLALYGETALFKRLAKYKASDTFERGVWVGKSCWNDQHVSLTPEGAKDTGRGSQGKRPVRWVRQQHQHLCR